MEECGAGESPLGEEVGEKDIVVGRKVTAMIDAGGMMKI